MLDLRALKRERLRRLMALDGLRSELFDKQLAVVDDPSKRKAIITSRRSGKTHMLAGLNIIGAQKSPGLVSPYIALTRGHAKRLMWPVLQAMNQRHNLGMVMNEVDLRATLRNGASIWLVGADDAREVEKLRGNAYARVSIDEAASFGQRLKYLVKDVLRAALADHDGECILAGTAGAACVGEFYEATTAPKSTWSVHRWNITDNVKFPRWAGKPNWREVADKFLTDMLAEEGWTPDHPTYRREWLGQWVRDDQSLVYRYAPATNSKPPAEELHCVMGVDLGFSDAFAIEVVGWSDYGPDVWELASFKQSGLTPTDWAALIRDYVAAWNPRSVVVDTGGLGRAIVEEFNKRHGLHVRAAEKTHKREYIKLLNDDFVAGRCHLRAGGDLANEMSILQWADSDRQIEDPRYENHCSDAFLYAWREAGHFRNRPGAHRPPAPGTPEAIEADARAMFDEPEQDDDGIPNWLK